MFHVKAENVAQSIESAFTDVETITISQAPDNSASTYAVTETTDGINIEWITPSSNWVDIAGYKVIYSETDSDDYNSDVWQYLYVSTDTSVTEYTIPWTDNFENWVAARFGWRLYNIFFKTYIRDIFSYFRSNNKKGNTLSYAFALLHSF